MSGKTEKVIIYPVARTEVRFVHTLISTVTIGYIGFYLYLFDELKNIGFVKSSPAIWLIIAGELMRWVVNKYYLTLQAIQKDHILGGPVAAGRKVSIFGRIKNLFYVALLLSAFLLAYAFICILFGAPVLEDHYETLGLSIVLVAYSVLPFCLYIGPIGTLKFFLCDNFELTSKAQTTFLEMIQLNAAGALTGAWLGCVVVPLDWDRWWQVYPIPNIVGAIVGFSATNLYTGYLGFDKKIRMEVAKRNKNAQD